MENGPFEDVFPIKNGDIPASYVSLPEGRSFEFGEFSLVSVPPFKGVQPFSIRSECHGPAMLKSEVSILSKLFINI